MTDELLLLPWQGAPRCGVGLRGHPKGWGLLVLQMLANLCILFQPTVKIKCSWKAIAKFTVSPGKVVSPCEIWEVKGLCGKKKSLAALNEATEGLVSLGAISQHFCLVPVQCFFLSLDPWAHLGAGRCKCLALPTFQCQQDALCRVYLLMGCFHLPKSYCAVRMTEL